MLVDNNLRRTAEQVLEVSWDSSIYFWQRNLGGNIDPDSNPLSYLRFLAGQHESLEILELIRGVPYKTLELLNPRRFRRHGDYLIVDEQCETHESPKISGQIISDQDWVSVLFEEKYFDDFVDGRKILGTVLESGNISREYLLPLYEDFKASSRLKLTLSQDWVSALDVIYCFGGRFDLIFVDLTEVKERLQVINGIQRILKPGGRAFIPFSWWRVEPDKAGKKNAKDLALIQDEVVLPSGEMVPLVEYLNQQEGFKLLSYPGAEVLEIRSGEGSLQGKITKIANTNRGNLLQLSPIKLTWLVL